MSATVDIRPNTFEEVTIGSQIWMKRDYDFKTPDGIYPDNNIVNVSNYGVHMTWEEAITIDVPGWHLPTLAEWQTLITYLEGNTVAGGHLKEIGTTYWLTPNTGADNSSSFSARGSGINSQNFQLSQRYWTSTEFATDWPYYIKLTYNAATTEELYIDLVSDYHLSVRLIKN